MSLIVVDVEADGPIPGKYSMVCLGAVVVEPTLSRTFYAVSYTHLTLPTILRV